MPVTLWIYIHGIIEILTSVFTCNCCRHRQWQESRWNIYYLLITIWFCKRNHVNWQCWVRHTSGLISSLCHWIGISRFTGLCVAIGLIYLLVIMIVNIISAIFLLNWSATKAQQNVHSKNVYHCCFADLCKPVLVVSLVWQVINKDSTCWPTVCLGLLWHIGH